MSDTEIQDYEGFSVEYKDASHRYWLNIPSDGRFHKDLLASSGLAVIDAARIPAISVTSALSILDKPALRRWQGNEDATAVLGLERDGELRGVPTDKAIYVARERGYGAEALRDKGGARGTAVHEALRLWCAEQKIPNLSDYPDETRGYVQAMCDFLVVEQPEPLIVERIVGSPQHGFAGRLDLIATLGGVRCLLDAKTSKNAFMYPETHIQLAGYCLTFDECGIDPVDRTVVLSLGEDGSWRLDDGFGAPSDFLVVLDAHRRVSALKKALKPAKASA